MSHACEFCPFVLSIRNAHMAYCLSNNFHIYLLPCLNWLDSFACSISTLLHVIYHFVRRETLALILSAFEPSVFKWSFAYRQPTSLLISPFISIGLLNDSAWASSYHFSFIFQACVRATLIEIFRGSPQSMQTWTDGTST